MDILKYQCQLMAFFIHKIDKCKNKKYITGIYGHGCTDRFQLVMLKVRFVLSLQVILDIFNYQYLYIILVMLVN